MLTTAEEVMALTEQVTVYTNVGWAGCHRAMEYLSQRGVPFLEKNIRHDEAARRELLAMKLTSLPVVIIGREKLTGFDPIRVDVASARLSR